MNNNIIRICLAAALPAMLWSCSKKIDNSAFSDVLGKDYNQEILWDVDSLAFRRASWSTTDASYGAEIRQAQIKMLGGTQSVSYITYPSNMFITRIAAADNGLQSTSELAAGSKAVFAINGGPCDASGATSFVMIGNKVISEGSGSVSGAGAGTDGGHGFLCAFGRGYRLLRPDVEVKSRRVHRRGEGVRKRPDLHLRFQECKGGRGAFPAGDREIPV